MRKVLLSLCVLLALFAATPSAFALTEICGNGVDDDVTGGDEACPEPDKDNDGYTTNGTRLGTDCDDNNRRIFAGAETTAGCSAGQYKTCQSNGTYTSCSAACPSGTCYYIDPVSGNDANAGTSRGAAFLTLNCVSYYASGAPSCNVHSSLTCGDHIYLLAGTHTSMHAESGYDKVGILLRAKACTPGNPITIHFEGAAVIDLPTTTIDPASAIRFDNCDGCVIKGGASGRITGVHSTDGVTGREKGAITIANGSSDAEVHGLQLDGNSGNGNENPAAIFIHSSDNFKIHHNDIFDQINDAGNAVNSCLLVAFQGTGGRVYYNSLRYTTGATANCGAKHKHGTFAANFEFDHNLISKAPGLVSGQSSTYMHHNVVADAVYTNSHMCNADDGASAMICDNGGVSYTGTARVEYNTFFNSRGYVWRPNNDYDNAGAGCSNCGSFGTFSFRNNVVVDNKVSYPVGASIGNVDNYGSDADYTSVITGGLLTDNLNCYYNSAAATLMWSLFGATPNTSGDHFTFAQMQSAGYCATCSTSNPTLDADLIPTAGGCTGYGWSNGETAISGPALAGYETSTRRRRRQKNR